jgi:hypothetical protein
MRFRDEVLRISDPRVTVRSVYNFRGDLIELEDLPHRTCAIEVVLGVTPDEGVDDCVTEALEHVKSLYSFYEDVLHIIASDWEGGERGPRDRVLIEVRVAAKLS